MYLWAIDLKDEKGTKSFELDIEGKKRYSSSNEVVLMPVL